MNYDMSSTIANWDASRNNLRPGIVDSNYSTFEQAIRIGTLDVGDIPPYFFNTGKNRSSQTDWNEASSDTG